MRIAVIADDLTGAAEIGGIGLRHNLKVEIARNINTDTTADMLIVDTDTRSKTQAKAIETTRQVSRWLYTANAAFLYKKIDSVMRGHVIAELKAQCSVMKINCALIVPANPELGRTLVNGHYYINQIPVHETSFRHDPEFAVTQSHVLSRFTDAPVSVQTHSASLPGTGFVIGEAQTTDDLATWAQKLPQNTLAVGAAGFFAACLTKYYPRQIANNNQTLALGRPILYISGSTFKQSVLLIKQLSQANGPVSYMPAALMQNSALNNQLYKVWSTQICEMLKQYGKVVIAIPQHEQSTTKYEAKHLRKQMALVVKLVFKVARIHELVIEGGSTAAAILEELNINSIFPAQELSAGVIRCDAPPPYSNLHITLKPGSYSWNNAIWAF